MNKPLRHWIVTFALILVLPLLGRAQQRPPELAVVEDLKTQAFKALKGGQFDRTSELIAQAASMSKDPALTQISESLAQFESQRKEFSASRLKDYEKAVADVTKLEKAGFDEAAIDRAKDARIFSADKEGFAKEQWVVELLVKAKTRANDAATHEQWIKAQRLYSDLGALEPADPQWKEKFKSATARLRLVAMYVPEEFKRVIEEEVKQREAADQLISPSTQPSTKPAANDENDSFKSDWHDMLRGIKMDMLTEALDEAHKGYWKDVTYATLANGGLKGLRNLVTTQGLEKTFPSLADQTRKNAFLTVLDQAADQMSKASLARQELVLEQILRAIVLINQNSIRVPEEVLVNEFADGAFAQLDPFSNMIWPDDMPEFTKSVQGEFSGVGIQIQLDDDGNLKVVSPLEDTPAYKARIKPGDIITRINGKSAKGISINQAVKNITGPSNTTVMLTIKSPDGTVKDHTIRRETIHVASVKGYQRLPGGPWDYFVDQQQKIAYMRITNFTQTTDEELSKAIEASQKGGAKAIVIDLRNNPGGLLTAATDVCDKFLTDGTIVSTKADRDIPGPPPITATASFSDIKLPVIVLVNQFSASASEIVSGALQDQKRALVVGERSFGKGSVQMVYRLEGKLAALKLTTSHYYLPSGRCLHKEDDSTVWGVDPDMVVEMTGEQMRSAQEARIQMEVLRESGQELSPTTAPAKKDLLSVDPQLSAAVLLLKLQLAGASS